MGVKVREKIKGSGVWWVFLCHGNKRKTKRVGSKVAAEKIKQEWEHKINSPYPYIKKTGIEDINAMIEELKGIRNSYIINQLMRGKKKIEIAKKLNMPVRTIGGICKREKQQVT